MLGLLSVRSWCNAVKLRLKSWIIGNSEMSRRDQPDSGAYEHLLEAGHRLVVDHVRAARHVVHCSAFDSAQFGNLLFNAAAAYRLTRRPPAGRYATRIPGLRKTGVASCNGTGDYDFCSLSIIGMMVLRSASGVIAPICLWTIRPSRSITKEALR